LFPLDRETVACRAEARGGRARLRPMGFGVAAFVACASEGWWSQTGSNRRPHACKARALPTELWPPEGSILISAGLPRRSERQWRPPSPKGLRRGSLRRFGSRRLVGPDRLELSTLRLSGVRSNHLSYGPLGGLAHSGARHFLEPDGLAIAPRRLSGDGRGGKRNGDGGRPAPKVRYLRTNQ
jgi:hypothetical protein